MENLQEFVINNYQQNMAFFQAQHPELHQRLDNLNNLINSGSYQANIDLQYNNGYFEAVLLQNGEKLYAMDSNIHAQAIADKSSFLKNEHLIETSTDYEIEESVDAYELTKLSDYHKKHIDPSSSMQEVVKYIFLGVGLGLHVQKVMEKFNPEIVYIQEQNLELFRLSLFVTNYAALFANTHSFFAIEEPRESYIHTFGKFYYTSLYDNHFLKFCALSTEYEETIQQFRSFVFTRPENSYNHVALLNKNRLTLSRLGAGHNFVDLNKESHLNFPLDLPCLVIASGPSLENNIEWLAQNHKKFIIIAAFSALSILKKYDIAPNIIVHIDESAYYGKVHFEKLGDLDFLKDSLVFLSSSVADIFIEKFQNNPTFFFETITKYKANSARLQTASIGEMVYSIALSLNIENIYLLGLDLALSSEGKTHHKEHISYKTVSTQTIAKEKDSHKHILLQTKGNFRQSVDTTPLLNLSINILNNLTKEFKSDTQNVYNLNDGAYFHDTTPLSVEKVKIDSAENRDLNVTLKEYFHKHNSDKLEEEEKTQLQKRKELVQTVKNELQIFEELSQEDGATLFEHYKIWIQIITKEMNEFTTILRTYFIISSNIMVDFFNTQKLKNEKKHVKKIKKMVINHMKSIISSYESSLEELSF